MTLDAASSGACQQAAAQTLQAEQAAYVASKLSHDFGNYLTGILGFTELSLQQAPPGGSLQRFLGEVLQSAKAGAGWIQRLHYFCRRTSSPGWAGCVELCLAKAKADLEIQAGDRPTLEIDMPPDLPMVAMDLESLGVMVRELIANTADACARAGKMKFKARRVTLSESDAAKYLGSPEPGEYVELNVSDDGPALTADVREKLLNVIFYSSKPGHRGLGLWITYGLLKTNGGGIRIAEPGPCGAFAATMVIPVVKVPKAKHSSSVLLVLSDPYASANMSKLLTAGGWRPTIAPSPSAALQMVRGPAEAFAVVVIETALGNENAVTLAARMLDRSPAIGFVFIETQSSFRRSIDGELARRFPLLQGPLKISTFFPALDAVVQARATNEA